MELCGFEMYEDFGKATRTGKKSTKTSVISWGGDDHF
jgi:hypothetical protein